MECKDEKEERAKEGNERERVNLVDPRQRAKGGRMEKMRDREG